jgi:hypothetical protein
MEPQVGSVEVTEEVDIRAVRVVAVVDTWVVGAEDMELLMEGTGHPVPLMAHPAQHQDQPMELLAQPTGHPALEVVLEEVMEVV